MKFVEKASLVNELDIIRTPYHTRPYDLEQPLRHFEMNVLDLIWPYHLHPYLLFLFLEFYHSHESLFKKSRKRFFKLAKNEPYFQFGLRIKPKNRNATIEFLSGFIELYETIQQHGFSLEKRVPVAVNPKGEIVPLKGAKRIAICLAEREYTVPVSEYAVIVDRLTPDRKELYCKNYTEIIRREMSDLHQVRVALKTFECINSLRV